ncbi:hypothetical protein GQ44DRAFT_202875 [Phaeosphaeriaceae sp. PMI808]|nr:hypothetical protein GQ44DRAFT_202875 [Phaeosphaeriaceae sp. PMI808]
MLFIVPLLFGSALVAAAPTLVTRNSAFTYDVSGERMSTAEVDASRATCWQGKIPWPLLNTPLPMKDVLSKQLEIYNRPQATSGQLTVHNYCSYPIYYTHMDAQVHTLAAGTNIAEPLTKTVFKASKSQSMGNDVLIEYAVANNQIYYDISLITCLVYSGDKPTGDASKCAGHELGLQLGNTKSRTFQCAPNKWCDDQVYLYQENMCKHNNPVTSCSSGDNGLTMEFCASKGPNNKS